MQPRKNTTSFTASGPEPKKVAQTATPAARASVAAAMGFRRRGRPDDELVIDETCPKTTAEDWKDAEYVNIQFTRRR